MKKYIFLIVCLLPISLFAQRGKASSRIADKKMNEKNFKYYEEIFGTVDKDFQVTTAPEEWADESVVVLCQKIHISFLRNTAEGGNQTRGVTRKRVLIQDKSALDNFSEFYYQNSEAIGINLIKADGTTNKIDLENAIKVETEVPAFYRDAYHSEAYFKIAIPNLEVGDILDYFKVFKENYNGNIELIAPISYSYPLLKQEIVFDVDKLWTFYYDSFNGAPKFKEDPEGGIDSNGRKRKLIKRFVMKTTKQDAQKEERWDYTYLTEPIIKIMGVPPNGIFSDSKNPIKNDIDIEDAFKASIITSGLLLGNTNQNWLKDKSEEEKINLAYRSLRLNFLIGANTPTYYGQSAAQSLAESYYSMKPEAFTSIFSRILSKMDIPCDLVLIAPRYIGQADDILTRDEMVFGVYVPSVDKYYWPVNNFHVPGEGMNGTYGATGYKVSMKEFKQRLPSYKPIVIPVSKADENRSSTALDINLNTDNTLAFNARLKYTGGYKDNYNNLLLLDSDYREIEEEYLLSFESGKQKERRARLKKNSGTSKIALQKKKEREEKLMERKKERKESIENWLKGEFEMEELIGFELISPGITNENNALELTYEFTSKDYVQKAGPNIIFDIGKLISGQIELSEEEINTRTKPVEFSFARTINNAFTITLPAGMKVQGIENLNMNIDNPDGAFISTAAQEGNTLSVTTSKVYKNQTVPAANWKNLVDMLEAAYTFSQQKVILKKE